MNWREWPNGAENEEIGQTLECPVCSSTLRPVEIWHVSIEYTFFGEERKTLHFTAVCLKCRTRYQRYAPEGTITINPDTETILELEERVRILEDTLSRLIAWIRTQQQKQPKAIQAQHKPQETQNDAEDFTNRYRHLL